MKTFKLLGGSAMALAMLATITLTLSSCGSKDDDGPCTEINCDKTIWSGPTLAFSKADGANWTQPANQDCITDDVCITRANTKGIFNIATETEYTDAVSPAGTEWAFGNTTMDLSTLTFAPWEITVESSPVTMQGRDMVIHLIAEDVYLDIKFTTWSVGAGGGQGGFSYERSTKP